MPVLNLNKPRRRNVVRHLDMPVVFLSSYPRSGNTFVRQVLFEAFGMRSYTVTEYEPETQHFGGFVGYANFEGPVAFVKTHEANQRGGRIWHIVRDGRDAVSSYVQWLKGESVVRASDWGRTVMAFDEVAAITTRYEDLIRNPIDEVSVALEMLGLSDAVPQLSDKLTSFAELHAKDPHHWRQGKVGDRSGIDVDKFTALNRAALERFGYL